MAFVRLLKKDLMKEPGFGASWWSLGVPTKPARSRGLAVPHREDLLAAARATRRWTATCCCLTRSRPGPDPARGRPGEAGTMGSVIAAGTSYATHGTPMIPVYVFSRCSAGSAPATRWRSATSSAAGSYWRDSGPDHADRRGAAAQRRPLGAARVGRPACAAYDAAWAFELAYIVKDALRRMFGFSAEHPHGEDIFYYLTVYNDIRSRPSPPTSPAARKRSSRASCGAFTGTAPRRRTGSRPVPPSPNPIPNGQGPVTSPPASRRTRRSSPLASRTPGPRAGRAGTADRRLGRGRRRLVGHVLDRAAP